MTPKEYRAKLTAELKGAEPKQRGYSTFLDKDKTTEVRQQSLENIAGVGSEDEIGELCHAANDNGEDPAIRASALQRLAAEGKNDEAAMDTILGSIDDSSAPPEVRSAAYQALKQLLFTSPAMRQKRSEYMDVLRKLTDDEKAAPELRRNALEMLARRKDASTQQRLIDTLEGKAEPLVSLAHTIQLLGNDIHTEIYPKLQEIVKEAADEDTVREAVRVLSADPASAKFLGGVYMDGTQSEQVRRAGGIAVQSLDPKLFETLAKQVAVDKDAPEGLRATSVQSLERFANPAALKQDTSFQKALQESLNQPSELMQKSVQRLQSKIQL